VLRPLALVTRSALDLLIDSSADALRFVIMILPWLPIIAVGLVLIGWLWRMMRRSRTQRATT